MRPRQSGGPGVLLAVLVFLQLPFLRFPFPLRVETTADLFDTGVLQELRLNIHSKDLSQLRARYYENTYYPADLLWRNIRVRNVAVRSRGFESRDPVKLALQLDFDRYTPGQAFLGLRALALDNLTQDPAMMREPLAMALFARMGQIAPRESFSKLYINNEYQGLYAIVEDIDQAFLARTVGREDGFLFEYHWLQDYYGAYAGDDLAAYKAMFEPRTHQTSSDDVLYAPIRALFNAFNQPEDVTGRIDLDRYLDLDQFVRSIAIETFLGDEDGIVGTHGMNNFYLYRDASATRHMVLVWDRDRSFSLMRSSVLERIDQFVLARRALAFDDLFDVYLQTLEEAGRIVTSGDWLASEIERLRNLLGPAAYADARKPFLNVEYEDAVSVMREWAAVRPSLVMDEVSAIRARRLSR